MGLIPLRRVGIRLNELLGLMMREGKVIFRLTCRMAVRTWAAIPLATAVLCPRFKAFSSMEFSSAEARRATDGSTTFSLYFPDASTLPYPKLFKLARLNPG